MLVITVAGGRIQYPYIESPPDQGLAKRIYAELSQKMKILGIECWRIMMRKNINNIQS